MSKINVCEKRVAKTTDREKAEIEMEILSNLRTIVWFSVCAERLCLSVPKKVFNTRHGPHHQTVGVPFEYACISCVYG
jgi:hypothetical protein